MLYGPMSDKQAEALRRLLPRCEWYQMDGLNKQEASELIERCIQRKEVEEGHLDPTEWQARLLAEHNIVCRTRSQAYAAIRDLKEKEEAAREFGVLRR
jgi:hypothetical protein